MLKLTRLNKIKELLQAQKQVDVQSLSRILKVSSVTIRSDLETLEQEGFLTRTHGGAVLCEEDNAVPAIPLPIVHPISEQMLHIGELAASHVKDREWVFLGSGYTCCAIAAKLAMRNVNIVTHNITASYILAQSPTANVMVLGGMLHKCSNPFLTGDLLTRNLAGFFFDKSFFGVSGISLERGYSLTNMVETNVLETVQTSSKEVIIVAASEKFGRTSHMNIGNLDIAQTVISDDGIPQEYRCYFEENNIRVLT